MPYVSYARGVTNIRISISCAPGIIMSEHANSPQTSSWPELLSRMVALKSKVPV